MRRESLFERSHQRDERKRNNPNRQSCVREKDAEIECANPTLTFERHGADLGVIDKIGNQKKARADKGRQHTGSVGANAPRQDQKKAGN